MSETNLYPRPQLVRKSLLSLDGEWDFSYKTDNRESVSCKITVPFCPEAKLSGVGFTGFMDDVRYSRRFAFHREKNIVLLHFGAVDYECRVYLNENFIGSHIGGYTPFTLDISETVLECENLLKVEVTDNHRAASQPRGKQSIRPGSGGCHYTRTTGIWQTVWIEQVGKHYISSLKIVSNVENDGVSVSVCPSDPVKNISFTLDAFLGEKPCGSKASSELHFSFVPDTVALWSPEHPVLYDIRLSMYADGILCDTVASYFGIRSVEFRKNGFYLNGKPLFLRTVLDQGFYPDGVYTAPSVQALHGDILLAKSLGFNGARMHQKVFDERYLYFADKEGYLLFGEYASWGFDHTDVSLADEYISQWLEAVNRDVSHPSVIGWCPFNETGAIDGVPQSDELIRRVYDATVKADDTRPCIDASGYTHVCGNIYDIHEYEQDPNKFAFNVAVSSKGLPTFVSEYGGALWKPHDQYSWGYGSSVSSPEEFARRYKELTQKLIENPLVYGFCYTQLTDVEQECNGLYFYDRKPKFDEGVYNIIRSANTAESAFEKENEL